MDSIEFCLASYGDILTVRTPTKHPYGSLNFHGFQNVTKNLVWQTELWTCCKTLLRPLQTKDELDKEDGWKSTPTEELKFWRQFK